MYFLQKVKDSIAQETMAEFSKRPDLRVEGAVVVGLLSSWRIAVAREGPDAFENWDQVQEIIDGVRERYAKPR